MKPNRHQVLPLGVCYLPPRRHRSVVHPFRGSREFPQRLARRCACAKCLAVAAVVSALPTSVDLMPWRRWVSCVACLAGRRRASGHGGEHRQSIGLRSRRGPGLRCWPTLVRCLFLYRRDIWISCSGFCLPLHGRPPCRFFTCEM